MVLQREDLLKKMVEVDDRKNENDKENGKTRIIETLKKWLESSHLLTVWIESVENKYPMPRSTKWFKIFLSFCIALAGIFSFVGDFGSDGFFTNSMGKLYTESLQNETLPNNCTETFQRKFDETVNSCRQISGDSGPIKCLKDLQIASVALENCYYREANRFSDSKHWSWMHDICLSHMVIPLLFCAIVGLVLACQAKETKWWMKMMMTVDTLPVVARIRRFLYERELYQLMSEKKTPENTQAIKDLEEKMKEHQKRATLAFLIEANTEAAFQFSFQSLYSLPLLILSVNAAFQDQRRSDVSLVKLFSLFNWSNFSILMSFLTMAYSYYSIR